MNKSKRTQCRYQKATRNQKTLDSFFSQCIPGLPESAEHALAVICSDSESVTIRQESIEVEIPPLAATQENIINIDFETAVPGVAAIREESVDIEIPAASQEEHVEATIEEYENDLEEDLDECIHGEGVDIRGWQELRQQIKTELKNHGDTLPITKINQLLVLRNFANLRLKGYSKIEASTEIARQWHEGEGKYYARKVRALARHYQVFEQLPVE